MKRICEVFPAPSKANLAFTLRKEGIVAAAERGGIRPQRRIINRAPFYVFRLIGFERI